MMTIPDIEQIIDVLTKTYDALPTTARSLRSYTLIRLREHERVLKLYQRAIDEYGEDLVAIWPGAGLERGMTIMTNVGPKRIKAFSATGVGFSHEGYMSWDDRDSGTPFVVIDTWVD